METGLKLLMRDGSLQVYFHPRLTAAQYAELMEIVEQHPTTEALTAALKDAAERWGVEVIID
jgi:hypothetical protein